MWCSDCTALALAKKGKGSMEIWDGYYRDGTLANMDLVRGEEIPEGLYHMVCEVLVRHVDGEYLLMQRSLEKPNYGGCFEATAGGSALKGEDKLACVKRELYEETGIVAEEFRELTKVIRDESNSFFHVFLCEADCDKNAITLQAGETIAYKWVSEEEFIRFVNSGEMIASQRCRYDGYFREMGYIK